MMAAYAWYYNDHQKGICYWAFAWEMSATDFASRVSTYIDGYISASDTSQAVGSTDLERHQRGMDTIHV